MKNAFPWGTIEWLAGAEAGNARELSLARLVVEPGKTGDTHVHANCEESIYVVRGEVLCRIGAQAARLGAGECTVVPRGAVRLDSGYKEGKRANFRGAALREFEVKDDA